MVEKVKPGVYRCEVCDEIVMGLDSQEKSAKQSALKHERRCQVEGLDENIDGMESLEFDEVMEFESSRSMQLKLGERTIGACPVCETRITTKHELSKLKQLYECPKCEKVVRNE